MSYPIWSGALAVTGALAVAQRDLGHTVHLLHGTAAPRTPYEPAASNRLQHLHPPGWRRLPALDPRGGAARAWRDARLLRELLHTMRYDVVHVHLNHDHVLARLARARSGCRLVRTAHARRSLQPRWGQRWLNAYADAWIVRCHEHAERLATLAPRALRAVIPVGIDLEHFRPPDEHERHAARARFELPTEARVVVQVALMAHRGQEQLAEAAARMKSAQLHLLFVGRGEHEAALRHGCDRLGVRAIFAGYLEGPDLTAAYHAADLCFVGPPGNDAGRRGALEAFACGLPVLGAPREALGEMLADDRGYALTSEDPEGVEEGLWRWWRDAHPVAKGRAARRWVETERTLRTEAQQTLALYARST